MDNFNVAGIASGFDWNAMIDQLMAIDRVPQQRFRAEQKANEDEKDALELLEDKLGTLLGKLNDFQSESLFRAKTVSLANSTLGITGSAATSAADGKYAFAITQLATASKRFGSTDVGGSTGDEDTVLTNLRLATDITEGTFEINGKSVSVSSNDTLQDVFDAISTATGGVVTASYDAVNDKVKLSSSSGQLELGSDDDTSNFLTALRLDQLEVTDAGGGASAVTSKAALGVVDLDSTIAESGIAGPITGTGTIYINGVGIDFDADTDSMQSLMSAVNSSSAGVTMSYDSASDQFRIVNDATGAYEMPLIDSGSGLLSAIGLTGAATVGDNLEFSVDGGATLTSRSNVITSEEHGIAGLSVTAAAIGTQTLTISKDSSELRSKIDDFIAAYNDVQDFIQEKTKISVTDNQVSSGVLAKNREITALDSSLRSLAFGAIDGMSGSILRLEHLGIDFISGTSKLEIKDSDALESALQSNVDTLEEFFMGDTSSSFSYRMEEFIKNFTESSGILDTRLETLTSRNSKIDDEIAEMERRLEFRRSALEASFIAMETAQQNLNNQSAALASLSL